MKNKILTILSLILLSFILVLVVKANYPYKENVLYTEDQLSGYEEQQYDTDNMINRNQAIEIATYILSDVLNVDMTKGNPQKYVEVYRDPKENDTYNWNIWWSRDYNLGNYGIEINSITGEILHIYINEKRPTVNTNISNELTKQQILDIIKPLTDKLEINLAEYSLKVRSKVEYDITGVKTPYKYCTFKNKKNDKFRIVIDAKSETIVSYMKNPYGDN